MLKIMTKMYVQNMPVAMFLAAQLVLLSFIFNISFVLTSADVQMLRNIKVSEKSLYYATRKESLDVDIEKLQNILGKERVGYIERNGKKCVDGMDSLDSPGLVYLGGVAQKISYKLSRGRWFSNAAHEVILARFNLEPYAGLLRLGWYVTIIFFMVYLLNTAIVFGCVIRNEEQKQGEVL